jgi:hypothetical protein
MIPKSLHTITALVRVALAVFPEQKPYAAALLAADLLGYPPGSPDAYGLIERAAAILLKGQK